jgi:2-dehydropantoate 2-reductase
MKVAVMGAGAVGCYYGAMLARARHPLTVVGRPQHVAAVLERGLLLETAKGTEAIAVEATTDPSGVGNADLVLFTVKSDDTAGAGRDMAPHLRQGAAILSLQNGVDNAERLQATLGRPVIPAAVYVAAEMSGPGHVRHHGRGELVIGPSPLSAEIAATFRSAEVPTDVSDNVVGVLWAKLIVNCTYNALSAIPQLPYGRVIEVDGVRDVMADIVAECLAVAEASNVKVPGDMLNAVLGLASSMPNQLSSTAQDLARGKRTEIDHLNGYVVRKAAELGIPTPVNRLLRAMVKLVEAKAHDAKS